METRSLSHPDVWRRVQFRAYVAKCVLVLGLLLLVWALVGCAQTAAEGRTNLAKTEIAATAAYKEATTLAQAGVIRPGSQTAVIIADAELAVAAAIRVWRTDPENPQYIAAGMNALPALVQLIADIKAGRK